MNVLVIEDEQKIADFIVSGFEAEGFAVHHDSDGFRGLNTALINKFDAIVLDVSMPLMDGFEVLGEIRRKGLKSPVIMLTAPGPAAKLVLKKAGMTFDDIDLFEVNEAFAAVVLKFFKDTGVDPSKVNVNGGAMALGHPIGATGALITVKALYELQRVNGRYALVTMCIGGGQGIAAIFERM